MLSTERAARTSGPVDAEKDVESGFKYGQGKQQLDAIICCRCNQHAGRRGSHEAGSSPEINHHVWLSSDSCSEDSSADATSEASQDAADSKPRSADHGASLSC